MQYYYIIKCIIIIIINNNNGNNYYYILIISISLQVYTKKRQGNWTPVIVIGFNPKIT